MLGAVIYRGPSNLDGEPIVAILTGLKTASTNRKTGAMLQTYILPDREKGSPVTWVIEGADRSVCGRCPHRRQLACYCGWAGFPEERVLDRCPECGADDLESVRTCYVNLGKGPNLVAGAFRRGRYHDARDPRAIARLASGRGVRLGTYGDPAAVPTWVWEALVSSASYHTGYTHQFGTEGFDSTLLGLCMRSADSLDDAAKDDSRTFLVRPIGAPLPEGYADCPSIRGVQCADCRLCGGGSVEARSISIEAHGPTGKRFTWKTR